MAQLIKNKKIKRTDLLLDAANNGAITDVTKPAVTTTEMAFAQAPIETASTKTSNATAIPTTQYSGMPTSAYQQMMGTYEPQLTAPLTEKVTPKTVIGAKTDPRPTTVTTQPTTVRTTTTVKNPRTITPTRTSNYDKLVEASDSGKQIIPLETVQEPIKEGTPIDKIKEAAGVTEPTNEKDLTDLANENYAKEYEDREEATLSNSEEANNSLSEKEKQEIEDKIDKQTQQGYLEHYEDLDESNKDIPEVKPEPTPEPKKEEGNGEVDWNSSDNPYLTKSEQLQKIIDEINARNEKRNKEYEDALKAKDDAYNELKQNSIDLLKGNNDEAWRDQKERINQSAANYRAELDAINKKSSMYYDDYLEMLGLKGSGAGAGLYNDMAVQNANVATQIEANRQNEIENARQANTDKLMALLEQAQKDGITLSDEEMKDILGTYSKDSLAAGTNAEATRWNRYNNLAKQYADEAEFNQLYQTAIVNGADDKTLAQLAKLYGKDGKTREMEAAEIVGKTADTSAQENQASLDDALDAVDTNKYGKENAEKIKQAIRDIYARTDIDIREKARQAIDLLNNPSSILSGGGTNSSYSTDAVRTAINSIDSEAMVQGSAIVAQDATEKDFGDDYNGYGVKGDTQYVWANTIIDLAKDGKIKDGTLVNFNVGAGSGDNDWFMYHSGHWVHVKMDTDKAKQAGGIRDESSNGGETGYEYIRKALANAGITNIDGYMNKYM